jgi:S-methylmethionine-dependent homocysteine/selenocysteine methylase
MQKHCILTRRGIIFYAQNITPKVREKALWQDITLNIMKKGNIVLGGCCVTGGEMVPYVSYEQS